MTMSESRRKDIVNNSKITGINGPFYHNGFRNAHASNTNAGAPKKEMFKFIFIIDWQCSHTRQHSNNKLVILFPLSFSINSESTCRMLVV